MSGMIRKMILGVVGLMMVGCLGLKPSVDRGRYYTLRSEVEGVESRGEGVKLMPVEVTEYLDRRGLVVGVSEYEIRIEEDFLWGEPLGRGIGRVLEGYLRRSGGGGVVRVRIEELKPRLERGDCWMVYEFEVARGGEFVKERGEVVKELGKGEAGEVYIRGIMGCIGELGERILRELEK